MRHSFLRRSVCARVAPFVALATISTAAPLVFGGLARAQSAPVAADPLVRVLAETRAWIATVPASDELWPQLAPTVDALLARTDGALEKGRRELALLTFAYAVENVAAERFLLAHAADLETLKRFEAVWRGRDTAFDAPALAKWRTRVSALRPAATRALGEAALGKLRIQLDASLDYGRATDTTSGLFYLGLAEAQAEFVEQLEAFATPSALPEPPARALAAELDALERELVAHYRPPLSIDRHAEFIAASSAIKEARVLDVAGFRLGALLRHGQAVQRCAALRPSPAVETLTRDALEPRIAALESELAKLPFDTSIGRIFAQRAFELVEAGDFASASSFAAALAAHVATFTAPVEPKARPTPELDVTLVRWPFT